MDPSLIPEVLRRMAEEFLDECARWGYDPMALISQAEDARAIREIAEFQRGVEDALTEDRT